MIKQKKIIFYFFIVITLTCLGALGFGRLYTKGRVKAGEYIAEKIKSEMKKAGQDGDLKWDTLLVSFFPLKIQMTKVKWSQNSNMFPQPLKAETLAIAPDYMALINKTLSAKITLVESNINMKIKNQKKKNEKHTVLKQFSLNFLDNVPVSNLILKETNLTAVMNNHPLSVRKLNADIRLSKTRVKIKTDTPFLKVGTRPAFSADVKAIIKSNAVYIDYLKFKSKDSQLNLSADIEGEISSRTLKYGKIKALGSLLSKDITAFAGLVYPNFQNPFQGRITLDSYLQYDKSSRFKGSVDLSAKEFSAWNVFLSKVQIKSVVQDQTLFFEEWQALSHNKWQIDLSKSKIILKKPYRFQALVLIKNSQLAHLLKTFHLKTVPLSGQINGRWNCRGLILTRPDLQCTGSSDLQGFTVSGGKNWNILEIPNLKIKNQFSLKNQVFTANTSLQPGADSLIHIKSLFKEGKFTSRYKGTVRLSDIKDLVSLQPKGFLNISEGGLYVEKSKINIHANLNMEHLILSQFHIGNVKTRFTGVKGGVLRFRKIRGQIGRSQYTGNLSVNVLKNTIQVFADFPYLTLQDLKHALKNRVHFPFEISGAGAVSAYLNGPLKINSLSYTLQARLFKVKWEKEFFPKAVVQIESKNGHVKTNKVEFLKHKGQVLFQGQVNPKGNMIATLTGRGLSLQESENISRLTGPEAEGLINFTMNLRGFFLNPVCKADITVKNSSYRGYPLKDSHIAIRIRKTQIEADGSFADRLTVKKLVFPYDKKGLVEIKAVTNNWNIKEFFIPKGEANQLYSQFQLNIDSDMDLSYKRNQPLRSATGNIRVRKLSVYANSYKLSNPFPFSLKLEKGNIHTEPALFRAGNSSLSITQNQSINIKGDLKLDFFIFLFPFMRVWEGDLKVDLSVKPRLSAFAPKGTLSLKNGTIHLHPYTEPFEDVQADVLVENSKLGFKAIYAKTGGGSLTAKGDVDLRAEGVPVNITGAFSHIHFSSLPGIYAKGSGEVYMRGNRFPYTLGIKARVEGARIEKEFVAQNTAQVKLSPRLFLLQENEESFEPIQMDFHFSLTDPVQVENSTMKSSFKGKYIKITGTPSHPLLSGTLTALPGGALIFRDHEFEILFSRIKYFTDKPSHPLIDLRAKTALREEKDNTEDLSRDRGGFSREYVIFLRVKGRAGAPVFTLNSTPALPEKDIVSILAFGSRALNFKPGDTVDNITKYSYYHLGPAIFQKAIGRELKNTLGVDQFLVVPHISSRDNSAATKLILRKKLFNKLNLSASQTVLDSHPESDIKVEYELNQNISIVGFGRSADPIEGSDTDTNILGLNVEYQIDF